uniref:Uncharacterized protein n=1 Tax=Hanusia phi TaxID=3032 RepID=A0A7S0F3Z2_9CRYP
MIVEHSGPQVDHSKVISSGDGQVRGSGLDRLRFLAGLPLDHGGGEEEETQEPLRSPGSETMQMKNLWTSLKQIPIIMDDYSVSVAAKDPTSDNSFSELCASVDPFQARQSSSLTSEASQDFASLDHGANMEAPAAEHEEEADKPENLSMEPCEVSAIPPVASPCDSTKAPDTPKTNRKDGKKK